MSDIALRVENLGKQYTIGGKQERYKTLRDTLTDTFAAPVRRMRAVLRGQASTTHSETIWALRDVSFEVKQGEVVGIIGRNGAGKSTLLKILSRITEPTTGYADIYGRVGSLLEVGTGFHPELTGRENIYLNGAILGMQRREIERKFDEIVAFAEVEKFIDTEVKHYSSGMYLRLAFSVAAHLEPEILLVDEVLAVGDAAFQEKCLGKMEEVSKQGRTVMFVSHNMGSILDLCRTGILIEQGRVAACGEVGQIVRRYQQALTQPSAGLERAQRQVWVDHVLIGDSGVQTIDQSQSLHIVSTLGINTEAIGYQVFCIIENARGERIIHSRVQIGGGDFVPGTYDLQLDVPTVWFNPGVYTIHFKIIVQAAKTTEKYLSDRVPFTVTGTANPSLAVLNPPVEWALCRDSVTRKFEAVH